MTDRLTCTDEELDALHKVEIQKFAESIGPWADIVKTDGYWKLTDLHREEWGTRVASRKKLEKVTQREEEKAALESEAA